MGIRVVNHYFEKNEKLLQDADYFKQRGYKAWYEITCGHYTLLVKKLDNKLQINRDIEAWKKSQWT